MGECEGRHHLLTHLQPTDTAYLYSQHVEMHTHTSSAASGSTNATLTGVDEGPRGPQGILDTLSDTFLNAFAKVRKPDEKFEVMKERLDKFDEGLSGVERVISRGRVRWTGE